MKVPKGYAKEAKRSAEGVPREVVAALLTRLMPRAPVARRKVEPRDPYDPQGRIKTRFTDAAPIPAGFRPAGRKTRKRSPKVPNSTLISLTGKGRRKLMRAKDTESWRNLHRLHGCETAREAYAKGLKPADLNYQYKLGTIVLKTATGEYL